MGAPELLALPADGAVLDGPMPVVPVAPLLITLPDVPPLVVGPAVGLPDCELLPAGL
jgi:hypothetical protein